MEGAGGAVWSRTGGGGGSRAFGPSGQGIAALLYGGGDSFGFGRGHVVKRRRRYLPKYLPTLGTLRSNRPQRDRM